MKKYWKAAAWGMAVCLSAAMMASCTGTTEGTSSAGPEESSSLVVEEPEKFPIEDAEALVKERLPFDFETAYTLSVNQEDWEWNGRHYYHFLISDEMVALETSVLVDRENQQVFTYYPDGSAYAPEDDPVCKKLAGQQEGGGSEASGSDTAGEESQGGMVESGLEWKGNYRNGAGVLLAIEPQDPNSFEFSLTDEAGNGLVSQVARSQGDGTAVSTSTEGLTVTFTQKDGKIVIRTEGTLPDGFASPDGEYQPAAD